MSTGFFVVGMVFYAVALLLWVASWFVQSWEYKHTPLLAPMPTKWKTVQRAGWGAYGIGALVLLAGVTA